MMSEPAARLHECGDIVTCPKCGQEFGREFAIDGVVFLECGNVIVHRMDAHCKQCGEPLYWVVPDIKLRRLIKRVLEARERP